jgi:hypothetical protein
MERIVIEEKTNKVMYKTIDGKQFTNEQTAREYENTYRCLLNYKYQSLNPQQVSEWSFSGFGCDDNTVELVQINKPEDIDTILTMSIYIEGANNKERLDKIKAICERSLQDKTKIAIWRGYVEDEDRFHVMFTIKEYQERLNKYDNDNENE